MNIREAEQRDLPAMTALIGSIWGGFPGVCPGGDLILSVWMGKALAEGIPCYVAEDPQGLVGIGTCAVVPTGDGDRLKAEMITVIGPQHEEAEQLLIANVQGHLLRTIEAAHPWKATEYQ